MVIPESQPLRQSVRKLRALERGQDEIGKGAAAKSDEPRRIEPLFEILEAITDRVAFVLRGRNIQELSLGHDRRNLMHRHDHDFLAMPNGDSLEKGRSREAFIGLHRGADVPMMRNIPLAHALLRVEVGQEVPEELYDAVAEVLNFVYGLRKGAAGVAA